MGCWGGETHCDLDCVHTEPVEITVKVNGKTASVLKRWRGERQVSRLSNVEHFFTENTRLSTVLTRNADV